MEDMKELAVKLLEWRITIRGDVVAEVDWIWSYKQQSGNRKQLTI